MDARVAKLIKSLRDRDRAGTVHLSDDDILDRLVSSDPIQKADPATEEEMIATLTRQLMTVRPGMTDQPAWLVAFSAAIHRHAEQQKAKVRADRGQVARDVEPPHDPKAVKPTAPSTSTTLTKGGVAYLWDRQVAEIAKRDDCSKSDAIDRLKQTTEGDQLWRAFNDPSIPTGDVIKIDPAPMPLTETMAKRSEAARQGRPALAAMNTLAETYRESEAGAGRRITPETAFSKVYVDPKNSALQIQVRAEEGRA